MDSMEFYLLTLNNGDGGCRSTKILKKCRLNTEIVHLYTLGAQPTVIENNNELLVQQTVLEIV